VSKKEIIELEHNIAEWQRLLGMPSHIGKHSTNSLSVMMRCGVAFDDGVFAVWKGKRVQFEMRSHQVSIGRNSSTSEVDFDLELEGTTHRLSRKQVLDVVQ